MSDEPRGRGRPSDPDLERRVLDATRRRLASSGYARMTIADVAADAGVTRPTVYKRWPNKSDLALAALQYSEVSERIAASEVAALPPRDALRAVLRTMAAVVANPEGLGLIGTVVIEEQFTPGLLDATRARLIEPGQAQLVETLGRAQEAGVLRADLDRDAVADLLFGALLVSYLRRGAVDDAAVDRVLDAAWPALVPP